MTELYTLTIHEAGTMRADWEAWNATMPVIPADASVLPGYSAKDMPQR